MNNDGDGLIDESDSACTTSLGTIIGECNSTSQYYINDDSYAFEGGSPCQIDIQSGGRTVFLNPEAPFIQGVANYIKLGYC